MDNKVYVGMFRKDWDHYAGVKTEVIICNCGEPLLGLSATREHWQMGHLDTPVYITAEEAYKIQLSLKSPSST